MTKILFLDMDGVLCTARSTFMAEAIHGQIPHNYIDKEAAAYLLSIVRKYDLKIVVSSVWRGMDHFIPSMRWFGFTSLDFHDDWRTGRSGDGTRGKEIDEWLNEHKDVDDKYVIFEDEPFDLLDHHKEKHLVKCELYNGIMYDSIRQFEQRVKELKL